MSEKSSRHFLGKKHTEETKARMSAAKQNYEPWNRGISHSEETKHKLKEAWIRRKARELVED